MISQPSGSLRHTVSTLEDEVNWASERDERIGASFGVQLAGKTTTLVKRSCKIESVHTR